MKRYLSLRAWAAGEGPVRVSSRPLMIQEELLSPGCTLPAKTPNVPVWLRGKLHGLACVCIQLRPQFRMQTWCKHTTDVFNVQRSAQNVLT